MNVEVKRQVVDKFLDRGYLLSPDFLEDLKEIKEENFFERLKKNLKKDKPVILNKDLFLVISNGSESLSINWLEYEKARQMFEKGRDDMMYSTFLDMLNYNLDEERRAIINSILVEVGKPEERVELEEERKKEEGVVIITKSYEEKVKKREIQDFVSYYNERYNMLKKILLQRQQLQNVVSINKVIGKNIRDNVTLIGIVDDKNYTKNGNIILSLEDPTGKIKILINKKKSELYREAHDVVLDEVIGINGVIVDRIVFVNEILFPDVPNNDSLKKADEEVYAVFTSDMHTGLNSFYENDFLKFIDWINCKSGSEKQKEIAKKVKYLFLAGDLVEGVGIYPGQEEDLEIKDIYKQYEKVAELIGRIRKDVKIIICGGNHDALRIAEPQPVLDKKFAKPLWDLKNVIMTTNPSLVNIHSSKDFEGFNVLLYHGYSFPYFADNVESIRLKGGMQRADLIMKYLLKRRHLAPSHSSTLSIPDVNEDPLVIEKIPDFFVTGHIHRATAVTYKNISLIGSSCWCATTPNQEKLGIVPDPSRIVLSNLKTREMKILKFGS